MRYLVIALVLVAGLAVDAQQARIPWRFSGTPPPTDLLTTADFELYDAFRFPTENLVTTFYEGLGIASSAIVGGNLHLFAFSGQLYQFQLPAFDGVIEDDPINYQTATLIYNWGGVLGTAAEVVDPPPASGVSLGGALATTNPSSARCGAGNDVCLYWTFGDVYAGNLYHNRSLALTGLDLDDHSFDVYGSWRTDEQSQRTKGYMTIDPNTGDLLIGAAISSGNSTSCWGACAYRTTLPTAALPADDLNDQNDISITTTPVIEHLISTPQTRSTDWFYTVWLCQQPDPPVGCSGNYDSSQGCQESVGNPTFTSIDTVPAMAWVSRLGKQGLFFFGQIAETIPGVSYGGGPSHQHAHQWYGPTTDCYGQNGNPPAVSTGDASGSFRGQAWIFNPESFSTDPTPTPIDTLTSGRVLRITYLIYNFQMAQQAPAPYDNLILVSNFQLSTPGGCCGRTQVTYLVFRLTNTVPFPVAPVAGLAIVALLPRRRGGRA